MSNVKDFYWDYADTLLRGLGVKESVYDERVLAFMALKMLIDNDRLKFNFDYKNNFNADPNHIVKGNLRGTFKNIILNIKDYDKTKYFMKGKNLKKYQKYNLKKLGIGSEIEAFNHKEIFHFETYVDELKSDENFKILLDIYNTKADFNGYPRNQYKNLYEEIVTRMKDLSGSLTGQHFTQDNIIHLMTEIGVQEDVIKKRIKDKQPYRIYDLACGVGSMLYESAYHISDKYKLPLKQIELLGQELNGPSWLLSKVFCEVQDIKNFVAYGNTLTEPFIMDYVGLKGNRVDLIIANPPFGMDYKSEEKKIRKHIMDNTVWDGEKLVDNTSNFYIFPKGNKKDLFALPKRSDGQFLFFMHNLRMMELMDEPTAKAVVLSSTSLASNGKETSNEGIIRKEMFSQGLVECIIEQPKAMFVNTDIKTHFWVLNNKSKKKEVLLINVDNEFCSSPFNGLKEMRVLFGDATVKLAKQKNGYRKEDIVKIKKMLDDRDGLSLFVKVKKFKDSFSISFKDEFKVERDSVIKYNLQDVLEFMEKSYFGDTDPELTEKVMRLVDGTLILDYFDDYLALYSKKDFFAELSKLEDKIIKDIEENILGRLHE